MDTVNNAFMLTTDIFNSKSIMADEMVVDNNTF